MGNWLDQRLNLFLIEKPHKSKVAHHVLPESTPRSLSTPFAQYDR